MVSVTLFLNCFDDPLRCHGHEKHETITLDHFLDILISINDIEYIAKERKGGDLKNDSFILLSKTLQS